MESLKKIIRDLSRQEVYLLRNLLKQQVNGCHGKRIQLFDLIRKNRNSSDNEAALLLYGSKPNSAFSHLKKRLKDDLLNFLFLNNFFENHSPDNCSGAKSIFYKSLLFRQIYSSKNISHEASLLQKSMEQIVGQHEFALEKLLVLEQTVLQQNDFFEMEEAEKIAQFIDEQCMSYRLVFMAKVYCKKMYHVARDFGQYELSDVEKMLEIIYGLKKLSDEQNLSTAEFWYCFLHSIYHWIFYSPAKALGYAKRALDIAEGHPEKFTDENLLAIKTHLSLLHLCKGDTVASRKYLEQPTLFLSLGHTTFLDAAEVSLHLCFCESNLTEAEKIIERELFRHKTTDAGLCLTKWQYYQACLEFAKGDFKKSSSLLMNKKESGRYNSSKLLLGHKLLELMNLIELGKYDLLEYKINAFKQLLKRIKNKNPHRYKLIGKQLDELMKEGYDFKATAKKQNADLRVLSLHMGICRWEPFNYEMIRFEEWLLKKNKQGKKVFCTEADAPHEKTYSASKII